MGLDQIPIPSPYSPPEPASCAACGQPQRARWTSPVRPQHWEAESGTAPCTPPEPPAACSPPRLPLATAAVAELGLDSIAELSRRGGDSVRAIGAALADLRTVAQVASGELPPPRAAPAEPTPESPPPLAQCAQQQDCELQLRQTDCELQLRQTDCELQLRQTVVELREARLRDADRIYELECELQRAWADAAAQRCEAAKLRRELRSMRRCLQLRPADPGLEVWGWQQERHALPEPPPEPANAAPLPPATHPPPRQRPYPTTPSCPAAAPPVAPPCASGQVQDSPIIWYRAQTNTGTSSAWTLVTRESTGASSHVHAPARHVSDGASASQNPQQQPQPERPPDHPTEPAQARAPQQPQPQRPPEDPTEPAGANDTQPIDAALIGALPAAAQSPHSDGITCHAEHSRGIRMIELSGTDFDLTCTTSPEMLPLCGTGRSASEDNISAGGAAEYSRPAGECLVTSANTSAPDLPSILLRRASSDLRFLPGAADAAQRRVAEAGAGARGGSTARGAGPDAADAAASQARPAARPPEVAETNQVDSHDLSVSGWSVHRKCSKESLGATVTSEQLAQMSAHLVGADSRSGEREAVEAALRAELQDSSISLYDLEQAAHVVEREAELHAELGALRARLQQRDRELAELCGGNAAGEAGAAAPAAPPPAPPLPAQASDEPRAEEHSTRQVHTPSASVLMTTVQTVVTPQCGILRRPVSPTHVGALPGRKMPRLAIDTQQLEQAPGGSTATTPTAGSPRSATGVALQSSPPVSPSAPSGTATLPQRKYEQAWLDPGGEQRPRVWRDERVRRLHAREQRRAAAEQTELDQWKARVLVESWKLELRTIVAALARLRTCNRALERQLMGCHDPEAALSAAACYNGWRLRISTAVLTAAAVPPWALAAVLLAVLVAGAIAWIGATTESAPAPCPWWPPSEAAACAAAL